MRKAPNLIRSSVVPHTIASETAAKANWKNHFEPIVASENAIAGASIWEGWLRKKPSVPANQPVVPVVEPPSPPKASAKPTAQYAIAAIERLAITLATMVPAFFIREKPASSS